MSFNLQKLISGKIADLAWNKADKELMLRLSRKNCHVRGLYSFVIAQDDTGALARLYIHEPGGGLSAPANPNLILGENPLAIHPHRRDLLLFGAQGTLVNINVELPASNIHQTDNLMGFNFDSTLLGGDGSFTRHGRDYGIMRQDLRMIREGDILLLPGTQLHTVVCPTDELTVWAVVELAENPRYEPVAYSARHLHEEKQDPELYQPFESIEEIEELAWRL